MLAPLDNEVIFKKAFTDLTVFTTFVHDVVGIDIEVDIIETEKKFSPKMGNIDFAYDIFAESRDHRTIIEMQKVEYDYHFDRFLLYHNMAIAELQHCSKDYKINREVFTIIILTAPYTLKTKDGLLVQDEVLVSRADPVTLDKKVRRIYGHTLFFLNSFHKATNTPPSIRDWLALIYASIHQQERFNLNLKNKGISRAIEIINFDNLDPVEVKENEGSGKPQKGHGHYAE